MGAIVENSEVSTQLGIGAGQNSVPDVPVGTNSFPQRYLFAFATQGELFHHIRTQALKEEVDRYPEILSKWQVQQPIVQALQQFEAGLADQSLLENLPSELLPRLEEIAGDALIQKSFVSVPFSFALVEIDKLVAPQRSVNLEYVTRLEKEFAEKVSLANLVEICLSPRREMPPIQHLETVGNSHIFSSKNLDVRFLGAFFKTLSPEDIQYAEFGGIPAAAIIAFVGYGAAPVNVIRVQNRLVLNNGFHRVFALRSLGVEKLPVLVQHVTNWQLEFPPAMSGLPREYLLGSKRPVLMKDFLSETFSITLRAKEKVKAVMLQQSVSQVDVPS